MLRFVESVSLWHDHGEMRAFEADIATRRGTGSPDAFILGHLESLTFDFEGPDGPVSAISVYAEPDMRATGTYHVVPAAETGYEGIACVDDTARAANLALAVYERSRSRKALRLARRWLTFVEYMQYPDGQFANFIRNAAGTRNATSPTSIKGGYWWTVRALWALARAYRLTGNPVYLERYRAGQLDLPPDCKLQAVMALAELELLRAIPHVGLEESIQRRCDFIVQSMVDGFFRDQPESQIVHFWGYHQLHAVASAAHALALPSLVAPCRRTVDTLIQPAIAAGFWHSYPARDEDGVCPYDVTPSLQGLAALHRATGAKRYSQLALQAGAWFFGRNTAHTPMYDPTTGRCRDGINGGVASLNNGAESAIEAGFAELERRALVTPL